MSSPNIIIIGLDSVPPALAFDHYKNEMPCLSSICKSGIYGSLRSTDPPITVPAWVSMTTGQSPSQLGIYGFRDRLKNSYKMQLVTQKHLKQPRIWDLAAQNGLRSVVVSVPLTYPVIKKPNIFMTSGFLTPCSQSNWAGSDDLKKELENRFGEYIIDVDDFRTHDKSHIAKECKALTNQHFSIFRHLIKTRKPHFAMIVDLGPDRFHHGMLRHIMPSHPDYNAMGKFNNTGKQYYSLLDKQIEKTVALAGPKTVIMIVSDHGVRPLLGAICINEFLIQSGFLVLDEYPSAITPLSKCKVNWSKTVAWGEGGYHGRIFLNVQNREPLGIVKNDQIAYQIANIKNKLSAMTGLNGIKLNNKIFEASKLYGQFTGNPPDLTVYFDDLNFRSVGTIGHNFIFSKQNDTGPDDANHDYNGIIAISGNNIKPTSNVKTFQILDVFATSMSALNLVRPKNTGGNNLNKFQFNT